jgi:hypothetical protein
VAGARIPSIRTTRRRATTRTSTGSWRGVVSLEYGPDGRRIRRQVRGQTKTEVRDKLRDLNTDIEAGVRRPQAVTIQDAAGACELVHPAGITGC